LKAERRGPQLLEDIESRESSGVRIWALGGAGFALRDGEDLVYIDPFLAEPAPDRPFHRAVPVPFPPAEVKRATAVLSTHEHNDHCNPQTLSAFAKLTEARFFGPVSSAAKALDAGYPADRLVTVRHGDEAQVSPNVRVTVFGSADAFEPNAVTYLLRTRRGTIFHSGDTGYFGGFGEVGRAGRVDVGLLNFGRQEPSMPAQYYMDAAQVARAAADLEARVVVPMHWDLWREWRDDPGKVGEELRRALPSATLVTLGVGEYLSL
jgi:L-ascorbate 6-phosphate lactonase